MTLTRSSVLVLSGRLAKAALLAVVSWILAHSLGPEERGTYGLLLLATPFLFKASNLGMSGANVVLVARDPSRLPEAVSAALWGGLGMGLLAVAAGALAFPLWGPRYLGFPHLDGRLLLVLALVPLGVAASQLEGILQAERRFGYVQAVHLAASVLVLGLLAFRLLVRGEGIDAALQTLAAQAVLMLAAFALPYLPHLGRPARGPGFWERLRFGASLEAVNALALLGNHAATFLLVPSGVAAAAIGNYFVAKGLAEMTWGLTDSGSTVLLAGISGMPDAEARATTSRACRTLLLLQVLACAGAWGAGSLLVPRLLPQYTEVMPTVLILLPGIALGMIPKVLSCYMTSRGRPLLGLWVTGVGCLSAFAVALALIPGHGIRGAVAATAAGMAAEAVVSLAIYCRTSGAGPAEALLPRPDELRGYLRRMGLAR